MARKLLCYDGRCKLNIFKCKIGDNMFYIIADDLTGANDTGVQFTKKGYNAIVSVLDEQSTIIIPDNLDVFVMDTETRELES
ncbi:MAG TPA: four-carbon acid sugar kinase family protein, partial [Atribacterota bacterium]|nr:four-carbon acid sugar kinase family protein [Atribacterota bacterium]